MIYCKKGSLSPRMICDREDIEHIWSHLDFFLLDSIDFFGCFSTVPPPSQVYSVKRED